jgi:hypothetical protein
MSKHTQFSDINVDEEETIDIEPIIISAGPEAGDKDIFEDINSHSETSQESDDYKEVPPLITDAEPVNEKPKSTANGEFLLFLVDTVVPIALKFGTETYNKKVMVDLSMLKMDYDEKALMRPSADVVAEQLFGNMSPMQQFMAGLTAIYASKLPDAITKK